MGEYDTGRSSYTSHTSKSSHSRRSGVSNPLFEEVANADDLSPNMESIPIDDGDVDPSAIRWLAKNTARNTQSSICGCVVAAVMAGLLVLCVEFVFHDGLFGSKKHHHHSNNVLIQEETPSLHLVETIPLMNFSLSLTPGAINTYEALIGLCNSTKETLDISVMYWNLLVDESSDDVAVSSSQKCAELGCNRGRKMYQAFQEAAARGVKLRFLQDNTTRSLGNLDEIHALISSYPDQISMGLWDANAWYGGGIMHMKLWISDSRDVYIGSANMDWLSLAQVKEMGVLVRNASQSAAMEAQALFDSFWSFSSQGHIPASSRSTVVRLDTTLGAYMEVPCWEAALSRHTETKAATTALPPGLCEDPLVQPLTASSSKEGLYGGTWYTPARLSQDSDSNYFISAAPAALLGSCDNRAYDDIQYVNTLQQCQRTFDLDGLVNTIRTCTTSVDLSVMDFLPSNAYGINASCVGGAMWWPDLLDAITTAALANGCHARFLVSWWTHSDSRMIELLKAFEESVKTTLTISEANGTVSVGVFEVPGYDDTVNGNFPPFSRVNHAKYVVTDRRVNIGTSNYQPSYFYQTAGASFNTDDKDLVASAQSAFNRDWFSSYRTPISQFTLPS